MQRLNILVREIFERKIMFFVLFIDSGFLLQPLCTLSQNSNLRVRPEIVLKLASKF
jgi:hypothetical protein